MSKRGDVGVKSALVSQKDNDIDYHIYLDRLIEIAISQFKWNGLPETVDPRYLERTILNNGSAIFFHDDVYGYVTLQASAYGKWSIYGIPTERTAYGANGYNVKLTDKDSVIIWNNMTHTRDLLMLTQYAKKLYQIDRTIDINVNAQKTPIIIKCNDRQRLTMINLYKKYDGNEPFIFADKDIDISGVSVLNTNAPYLAQQLYDLKMNVWNECLTYLGVVNVQANKKERLITDEVQRMNGGTMASRQSRLNAREQACEEINKMFGLNISVEINDDNSTGEPEEQKEGENNGELHNENL